MITVMFLQRRHPNDRALFDIWVLTWDVGVGVVHDRMFDAIKISARTKQIHCVIKSFAQFRFCREVSMNRIMHHIETKTGKRYSSRYTQEDSGTVRNVSKNKSEINGDRRTQEENSLAL